MKTLVFAKSVLLLGLSFASSASWAQTSATLIQHCDGGRLEDICWDNGQTKQCRRQLIFTGATADALRSAQMIFPNQRNEILLPELERLAQSSDYRDRTMAYRNGGRVVYVKPGNGTLTVESFWTTQATGGQYSQMGPVGVPVTLSNCQSY